MFSLDHAWLVYMFLSFVGSHSFPRWIASLDRLLPTFLFCLLFAFFYFICWTALMARFWPLAAILSPLFFFEFPLFLHLLLSPCLEHFFCLLDFSLDPLFVFPILYWHSPRGALLTQRSELCPAIAHELELFTSARAGLPRVMSIQVECI